MFNVRIGGQAWTDFESEGEEEEDDDTDVDYEKGSVPSAHCRQFTLEATRVYNPAPVSQLVPVPRCK